MVATDRWDGGGAYEAFMGRWSRLIADRFVQAMSVSGGLRWLDVGCGTGALLHAVTQVCSPQEAVGVDPSAEFVQVARARLGEQADIRVAGGEELPFGDDTFDLVVSGLVLNFVPDPLAAVVEWKRVLRRGGSIAAYVWDYADGMEFLRCFWDAAVGLDAAAASLDEGVRFPICRPERLADLFGRAGLSAVRTGELTVDTRFTGFNDYWTPFLAGQGPAPGYVAALGDSQRARLEARLRSTVPVSHDGSIRFYARAWTVSGKP